MRARSREDFKSLHEEYLVTRLYSTGMGQVYLPESQGVKDRAWVGPDGVRVTSDDLAFQLDASDGAPGYMRIPGDTFDSTRREGAPPSFIYGELGCSITSPTDIFTTAEYLPQRNKARRDTLERARKKLEKDAKAKGIPVKPRIQSDAGHDEFDHTPVAAKRQREEKRERSFLPADPNRLGRRKRRADQIIRLHRKKQKAARKRETGADRKARIDAMLAQAKQQQLA